MEVEARQIRYQMQKYRDQRELNGFGEKRRLYSHQILDELLIYLASIY